MKTKILAAVFILFAKYTFAQQELLSFDEHNKYIFYKVIDLPGINEDSLHSRTERFLKTVSPKLKLKAEPGKSGITCEGKLLTHGGLSLAKHENGEVAYQLNIEFKDQKYRFWLTDFVYTSYARDRYGNFVPQVGKEVPLEEAASKLEKKELNGCLNETGFFCKQFDERLKVYLINAPKKEETVKKVVVDKW